MRQRREAAFGVHVWPNIFTQPRWAMQSENQAHHRGLAGAFVPKRPQDAAGFPASRYLIPGNLAVLVIFVSLKHSTTRSLEIAARGFLLDPRPFPILCRLRLTFGGALQR